MDKNEIKFINTIIKAFIISLIIFMAFIFIVPKFYIVSLRNIGYFDENAKELSELETTEERLLRELQEYVDANNFSIKMNSEMIFPSGSEAGSMNIQNPEKNNFNMSVEIYIEETNELVYKSGILKPGEIIATDSLRVYLEKGIYNAKAIVSAISPSDNSVTGIAKLDVILYILK